MEEEEGARFFFDGPCGLVISPTAARGVCPDRRPRLVRFVHRLHSRRIVVLRLTRGLRPLCFRVDLRLRRRRVHLRLRRRVHLVRLRHRRQSCTPFFHHLAPLKSFASCSFSKPPPRLLRWPPLSAAAPSVPRRLFHVRLRGVVHEGHRRRRTPASASDEPGEATCDAIVGHQRHQHRGVHRRRGLRMRPIHGQRNRPASHQQGSTRGTRIASQRKTIDGDKRVP
jgi:hypothetical protein